MIQFQIECRNSSLNQGACCICEHSFEAKEAKVIVCDDQGENCGEVCPTCISQGYGWIQEQFTHLSAPLPSVRKARTLKQRLPIGA
ncbi:MAG: hypothetical protein HC780_05050 [Leptolyngbyaceae cyanobacterium CSU_1_3]|nr:hypothetical protein [Leptolyngbyaceae cyanobacterium CSU_1_3]